MGIVTFMGKKLSKIDILTIITEYPAVVAWSLEVELLRWIESRLGRKCVYDMVVYPFSKNSVFCKKKIKYLRSKTIYFWTLLSSTKLPQY